MSTAYHLQTDGLTECTNQTLETFLHCLYQQDNWVDYLPVAKFAFNNAENASTKQSPFFLMMGYEPQKIPDIAPITKIQEVNERVTALQKARDEALAAHELARQRMIE